MNMLCRHVFLYLLYILRVATGRQSWYLGVMVGIGCVLLSIIAQVMQYYWGDKPNRRLFV